MDGLPPMHHVRTQRKGGLAHVVQASLGLPAFQMNPRAAQLGRRRRADGCSAMGGCGVLVAAPGHVGPAEGGLGRQCRHPCRAMTVCSSAGCAVLLHCVARGASCCLHAAQQFRMDTTLMRSSWPCQQVQGRG